MELRKPQFADDRWYPATAEVLRYDVQRYLAGQPERSAPGRMIGLVVPHAGYAFSGHVAGIGFAAVHGTMVKTVVLLGPDHQGAAPGKLSTPTAGGWATPLGQVPVDRELVTAIEAREALVYLAADQEHSLEVELPFLQEVLTAFNLVPLMMGNQSPAACGQLAQVLADVLRSQPGMLLVASSDLSHYFDDATARRLDTETLAFIQGMDPDGLVRHVEGGRRAGQPLACGGGPIAVVMQVAQDLGANRATLLKYATSGDVWPDKRRVVGYAAVAFTESS